MSRRTTPSSDEFRDDLDFDQLTWENELAREQARQQRRRQAGLQRDLSERLEGHTTPLAVGVGRSPLVTPTVVRDALQRAMDLSGIPTVPPAGVGVAPNVSSPSSGVASVTAIRAAAQDLPSPTFSPRQIDVMERILRNTVPEDEIDALLDSVGLEFNQLTDYIAQRPPSPTLSAQQIDAMERIARGNFLPGQIESLLTSVGLNKDNCSSISSTVPRHPKPLHHPGPEAEVEAGDAAGCHPEGVAGTMEARPVVGVAAAAEEGDVVAVAVGVGVAAAPPLDERA